MTNRILIVLVLAGFKVFGQIIGVDTLLKSGPMDNRINLVFMGDGYTSSEMTQFIGDATTNSNYLLSQSPFSNYKNYFNVYAIKVASPQSGVTHPGTATDVAEPQSPVTTVTNLFNTRFDNYNIHRNIYCMNPAAVYSVVALTFPNYDQLVILGNSTEYGGAGGAFAVSSINASSPEIVAHEMGHSFAGLADEYWAGTIFAGEHENMTSQSNASLVKWASWVGTGGIGVYPHGSNPPESNWFKPHQNCKMQFLNSPFCAVCKQTIIEKIHSLVSPIDGYYPDNTNPIVPNNDSLWFKGVFVKPSPNTLKTTWDVNSGVIASNKDSVMIPDFWLMEGSNLVTLTVTDTTKMSHDTSHVTQHIYSVSWVLSYSTAGIKEIKSKLELSVFPNPASEILNIKYNLKEESEIGISIADMNGKIVLKEKSSRASPGAHKNVINVGLLNPGNYILSIKLDQHTINQNIVIVK